MLYAPKLLLPSQHLHQLQECLVTSHLPGPNILGMCKGIRMLYLEGCACLVKTTKRQRARLGRGDDILSTIYTYDVYKQLYKHVYIYIYYIIIRITYVHVFNIFYPSIFPESPVYHPQLKTFIKKSQASCTAASPYLTPNISPTGSLFTMSLTHLSDTSLTTELAGETCKEVPATISRSASVSSGSCLKNLRKKQQKHAVVLGVKSFLKYVCMYICSPL